MKIPPYAAHVPLHRLVSIQCRGACNARRWAELVVPTSPVVVVPGSRWPGMVARCLRCGSVAAEDERWIGP